MPNQNEQTHIEKKKKRKKQTHPNEVIERNVKEKNEMK